MNSSNSSNAGSSAVVYSVQQAYPSQVIPKHEAVAEVIEDNFSTVPLQNQHFPLPSISSFPKRTLVDSLLSRPAKHSRMEKKVSRTVVCIPYNSAMITKDTNKKMIKIPRGYRRTYFAKLGLITKVEIGHNWPEERLRLEISNLFKDCFVDCDYLNFSFLTTMPEFKILEIPDPQRQWDGAAVTSLSRDLFYILSDPCHILKERLVDTPPETEPVDLEPSSSVNELAITNVLCTTKGQVTSTSNMTRTVPSSSSLYNDYLKLLSGEEPNNNQAIQDKLSQNRNELGKLKDGIEALKLSICDLRAKINDELVNYVYVNRQTLFDDAILNLSRKNFQENARFFVRFSDDLLSVNEKVYTDGLNREYFRLVMANLINSSIFAGEDTAKYLTKCDSASSQDHYFLFGRLIALSIIHGGPGPHCFSRLLYHQILNKPRTYSLSLLASTSAHELISKISNATTSKEFFNAVKRAQLYLDLAGITQIDFSCKNEIVVGCLKFYLEDRVKEEIERFRCGLNTLGLLDDVTKHPKGYQTVFLHDGEQRLTAAKIIEEVFLIQYSEGIDAAREGQVIEYWQNYLFDIEEGNVLCRFEDLLIFCTGSDRIPPAGFNPRATITFSPTSRFPESKTCSNILSLPLGGDNSSYESFRDTMEFAILNSQGFG